MWWRSKLGAGGGGSAGAGRCRGCEGGSGPARLQRGFLTRSPRPGQWRGSAMAPTGAPPPPLPFAGREQSRARVHSRGAQERAHGCCRPDPRAGGGVGEGGGGQPRLSLPTFIWGIWGHGPALLPAGASPSKRVGTGAVCDAGCWVSPCPGALPSCHPGDPHGAVAPHRAPPTHAGVWGWEALGQLVVLLPSVSPQGPCVGHPSIVTMSSCPRLPPPGESGPVGPHGRDSTGTWQAVTWSPLCRDAPHHSLPDHAWQGPGAAQGQQRLAPLPRAGPVSPAAIWEQALGAVPAMGSPFLGTAPAEGLCCATCLAGTGGAAAELQSCAAPLPP